MLEMPQAMRWLWPMSTSGTPGNEKPVTSKRPAWRPFSTHSEGMLSPRWVSFASSAWPVAERLALTTQLLLPRADDGGPR